MSGFTRFVVAGGSGKIGSFIVKELASRSNIQVTLLSRSTPADTPANVEIKSVDYSKASELEAALKGTDVVISALGGPGLASQAPLAQASKNAGVQLFVPSEYGNPSEDLTEDSPIYAKREMQLFLQKIKLPSLLTFTGPFTDLIFIPMAEIDFAKSEATIVGTGDTPISFTTRTDVARFLAEALLTFPAPELENKILRLEGDRKSLNQVLDLYEKTHVGKKIKRTYTPISETEAYIAANPGHASIIQWLLLSWEKGSTSDQGGKLSNDLWKEWNPQSVEQVLAGLP